MIKAFPICNPSRIWIVDFSYKPRAVELCGLFLLALSPLKKKENAEWPFQNQERYARMRLIYKAGAVRARVCKKGPLCAVNAGDP
jgi:hypothetical protein